MRKDILGSSKQFRIGLKSAENVKIENLIRQPAEKIKKIIICGMGGSALPADILKIYLQENKIILPVKIHRDYDLPYSADKETDLVICISYSGNTEETLSAFEKARISGFKIMAIASGGKLAELCRQYGIPIVIIPKGLQPRLALGYQFSALIKILANCELIKNNLLDDILSLENLLKPKTLETYGKKIAKKLKDKIPLIYASKKFKNLARIWKIKFNENSKIPAFSNYFPELNHNELVGFENDGYPISVIILRDALDQTKIKKRMELTAKILRKRGIDVDFIDIIGKDILYKVFSNILLADWASYYLALEYKINPTPVKIVEELKAGMAEWQTR